MSKSAILILFIFSLLVSILSCGKSPQTIATVGNEEISISELKDLLNIKKRGMQLSRISFDERQKILMNHLENRAKAMKAKEFNLDDDPQLQAQLRRREERILASKYPEICWWESPIIHLIQ